MRRNITRFVFFLSALLVFVLQTIKVSFAQTSQLGLRPTVNNYTSFSKKHITNQKSGTKNNTLTVNNDLKTGDGLNANATEVIEKRTLNTKYFVDKDTASKFYQLISYGGNLHYQKNGKLLTIDERLEPVGNGLYEAANQQEPVGFDVRAKTAFIKTISGKVNFNNWTLYGEKSGVKTVLAQANWSHYSAGDNGLMVYDIFPGIDAEMKVQRGAIKTNFIIRKNQFPLMEKFTFEDHFNTTNNAGALVNAQEHQQAKFVLNNKTCLDIGRAIAYTAHDAGKNYEYLDYTIISNVLSFGLDASFINQNLASGSIIIDPLVSATATLAQNAITGSMNCGSSSKYCSYKMTAQTPPKATFTNISFTFEFYAYAPSGQNQGHFFIKNGTCSTGIFTVVNPTTNTGPGSVNTNGSFYPINSLLNCLPAPSCVPQDVQFELDFYNDYCAAGTGCSDTYVKATQPLIIKIEGYTLELSSITSPVTICSGSSATLNVAGQYGVPPYTYKWNNGATTSSISVSPATSTTYSAVVTDQCGNTTTASTSVTVNPTPVITSVTGNSPLCTGSQLNLSVPLITGATYSWTGPNNFTSSSNNPILSNVTIAQAGTYKVTETINGCTSAPLNVNVEIGAPSTPAISIAASATTVGAGTNVTFTATPVNGGSNPAYQWKLNGINTGTNSNIYSNNNLADNDIVTCVLTSSAACTTTPTATSNSIAVKINPVTISSVGIKANTAINICAGTSVTFMATPANGGDIPSYQWLLNGNKVGKNAVTYTNNALNDQDEVSCILTSNAPCATSPTATSNSIKFNVTQVVTPDITVTASATAVCPGTKIIFNATAINGGNNPIYQWKVNNIDVGINSSSYESSVLINGDVITCTIKSDVTCVTTAFATSKSITIIVNSPVTPAVSIAASATTVCAGANVTFTATPVNGGMLPVYQWKLNGINTGTNSASYSNNALNSGDVLSCVLTSNAPCTTNSIATSNPITIVVNPVLVPSVSITASSSTVCAGTPVTFTASVVNCGNLPNYDWKLNGNSTGTNSVSYTNNALKDGDIITCLVTPDNSGCFTTNNTVSNAIIIKVSPIPVVSAGRDTVVFKGSSFTLNGHASGSITQYFWTPTTYLNNSTIANPVITPLTTTKYTLHAISTANCESTADVTIKVLIKIVIPNTFTPNGDGINDTWAIAGLADYPGSTIDVYNRYGQLVLHSSGYKQWDGTLNGNRLPVSTYYYVINPKNNMSLLSGWVAIVR